MEHTENHTCGIFLVDVDKRSVLVAHATNSPWTTWGIPKGLAEPGEDFKDAAIREFQEETGLCIDINNKDKIIYLGTVNYNKGPKKLVAFLLKYRTGSAYSENGSIPIETQLVLPDVKNMKCTSMVFPDGEEPFPEVDKFKWLNLDDPDQIKSLYFPQRQIIPILIKALL